MAVCSTGAGSARPVVSSSTRRNLQRRLSRSRNSVSSASTRSPRMVQHRQPLCSSTMLSPTYSTSRWSSEISPNSLMMTAVSASAGSFSSRLSSVVLPAPRKPVSTVSGIGAGGWRRSVLGPALWPASLIATAELTFGLADFAGFAVFGRLVARRRFGGGLLLLLRRGARGLPNLVGIVGRAGEHHDRRRRLDRRARARTCRWPASGSTA